MTAVKQPGGARQAPKVLAAGRLSISNAPRRKRGRLAAPCAARFSTSILIASEPLTKDTAAWVELPEYGALFAEVRNGRPRLTVRLLD